MKLPDIIKNTLNPPIKQIVNEISRGVGAIGVSLGKGAKNNKFESLIDQMFIEPSIAEARRALQIDPTVSSSVLSMVILANSPYKVVPSQGAADEAVDFIEQKCKSWNIRALNSRMLLRSIVDNTCFIRKNIDTVEIKNFDFLTYDETNYNFLPVIANGELLGYKQKGMVYEIPKDWKNKKFDEIANPKGEVQEFNFEPHEVINPVLFEDNFSLVMKALDDVRNLKKIKNMGPNIVKFSQGTLGVEVGTEENPFAPYDENDSYSTQKSKVKKELEGIADAFDKKESKNVIAYSYGTTPNVIGDGKVVDWTPIANFYKQEIRESLLTPDSRFTSAKGSRFTAEAQMGTSGQGAVISFLQDFSVYNINTFAIDHQLAMANYEDSIGKISIEFESFEVEDDKTAAEIGQIIEQLYPSANNDNTLMRMQAFFPKYYKIYQDSVVSEESNLDKTPKQINNQLINGFVDHEDNTPQIVDYWYNKLVKEGIIKS
ncbi:hypothetical protein MBCUT_06740 [Methanobrevibacter cuticularis]|uniref:Phage portal protein n=1 Tax=Methanobrevibacter cuticularis TaxID=47311 RepID=A0A166EGR3_9EURY|nr:hypothetical protein [Methanobrevibacter cuticularis]KZX16636.1 hypothetical protein MBCUT_06740 [Methanobrevibacter cuticularis]